MSPPHRGLLDRIDGVIRLLAGIDLSLDDKRSLRSANARLRNAELELNEMRRQVERHGQETP